MTASPSVRIRGFFHEPTNTVSYLVWQEGAHRAVVIDPVLDFDHRSGKIATNSVGTLLEAADGHGLSIEAVLETHAHADHLSGAPVIKARTGAWIGIGEHIREVQRIFAPTFNARDVSGKGAEFDRLFADGERAEVAGLTIEVLHTPGHTPACISYRIGDAVFVGDTLFMPDYGTARADFPGGDARTLYRSIRRLLGLPGQTRLFLCHDYLTEERKTHVWETTVAEQNARNVHVHSGVSEEAFVTAREARDKTLDTPLLLLPSVQVNIRAGNFPPPEDDGRRYLKIPVTG